MEPWTHRGLFKAREGFDQLTLKPSANWAPRQLDRLRHNEVEFDVLDDFGRPFKGMHRAPFIRVPSLDMARRAARATGDSTSLSFLSPKGRSYTEGPLYGTFFHTDKHSHNAKTQDFHAKALRFDRPRGGGDVAWIEQPHPEVVAFADKGTFHDMRGNGHALIARMDGN